MGGRRMIRYIVGSDVDYNNFTKNGKEHLIISIRQEDSSFVFDPLEYCGNKNYSEFAFKKVAQYFYNLGLTTGYMKGISEA
jgi:hypothetical protein